MVVCVFVQFSSREEVNQLLGGFSQGSSFLGECHCFISHSYRIVSQPDACRLDTLGGCCQRLVGVCPVFRFSSVVVWAFHGSGRDVGEDHLDRVLHLGF